MAKWEDYYELLDIPRNADAQKIKAAYRHKSQIFHPDQPTGNEFMMKLLNDAYEVLSDAEKKATYDREWDRRKGQTSPIQRETGIAKRESATAIATTFPDHYRALNISRNASQEIIRSAYLEVLKNFQEGTYGQNTELSFQIVSFAENAYNILINPATKAQYDALWDKNNKDKNSNLKHKESVKQTPRPGSTNQVNKSFSTQTQQKDTQQQEIKRYTGEPITSQRQQTSTVTNVSEVFNGIDFSTRKGLLAVINMVLLEPEKLNIKKRNVVGGADYINAVDCYGIFYEDYTFQFVREDFVPHIFDDDEYYLRSISTRTILTELVTENERYWAKFGTKFNINGQQAIIYPIDRIIPAHMFQRTYAPSIKKEDLVFAEEVIKRLLIICPQLLDAYFNGMTPNSQNKKMK